MVKKKFHCPECEYLDRGDGLRKATAQFNFATEYPNIAREWHERNKKPPSYKESFGPTIIAFASKKLSSRF